MANYQQLTSIYALQSPSGSRPPAQANTVIMGGNNHDTRLTFAEAHMQHAAGHPAASMHPYQQLQSTQQPGGAYPYAPTPASQMPMPQYTYIQVRLNLHCSLLASCEICVNTSTLYRYRSDNCKPPQYHEHLSEVNFASAYYSTSALQGIRSSVPVASAAQSSV